MSICRDEGWDLGEAADMFIFDAAFEEFFTFGVIGEESAMKLL